MKPYPLGIDNPIKIKAVWGSHKWALYWKDDHTKIATFPNEFTSISSTSHHHRISLNHDHFQENDARHHQKMR